MSELLLVCVRGSLDELETVLGLCVWRREWWRAHARLGDCAERAVAELARLNPEAAP